MSDQPEIPQNGNLHVMVDLETLGRTPTAAFQQIGYCLFDIDQGRIFRNGNIFVNVHDCTAYGLTMDWDTVKWWLQQSERARYLLYTEEGLPLAMALEQFAHALPWAQVKGFWSHGASFDIPILNYAWHRINLYGGTMPTPWDHHMVRDTRTIFMIAPPQWPEGELDKHRAETDAVRQAQALMSSWRRIGEAFGPGFNLGFNG